MNKIYRVVWNETTQTWNAVAEFAKAHGKTASSGIGGIVASVGVRFAFTAIMSGLLLASGQAVATVENNGKTLANGTVLSAAADGTDYNTCYFDTVSYNVVCGDDTTKALDFIPQTGGQPPKQGKSVAIGQGAQTSGESNVAIGPNLSLWDRRHQQKVKPMSVLENWQAIPFLPTAAIFPLARAR